MRIIHNNRGLIQNLAMAGLQRDANSQPSKHDILRLLGAGIEVPQTRRGPNRSHLCQDAPGQSPLVNNAVQAKTPSSFIWGNPLSYVLLRPQFCPIQGRLLVCT